MRHSFYRIGIIFALLITMGAGTAWANTTHPVYCAIRPSSLGETGELYLNVHKGTTSDGGVWYRVKMDKMATTIHKAETGETKDLYVASIEYVEVGLQQMEFQIYDAAPPASPRETHVAFNSWTTSSDTWTKQVFDYENGNFTTYPASLTQKKSYVYFDAADWNDDVKQLVISHGTYRGFNNLNHLSNTTLYYANPDLNWGDAVCISFIGNSTSWSETGKWLNDIPLWSTHYTGYLHYSLSENSFNYFARRSGDEKGAALSYNYWGTESTAYQNLNKTQTVQARVKATGSSYSDVSFSSWPGSVSAERTYMSSATATTSPSAANMTSATTDAVLTSSITLTASANSGYYFEGWGDASDSNPTDGTTAKTYSVTDTKTSYAFFSQTYTLTYDRKGDYSTSTLSVYSVDNFSGSTSSGSSIPTGHLITLVATPATGYEVEGWYSDAACTSPYTNGSGGVTIEGNTFKLASLNANTEVYCKFRPITYTVTLEGMEADGGSVPIQVNVTYDAVLAQVTPHTKAHYDFLGYWAASDDHGEDLTVQLIDANGNWIPDVTGYTGHSGESPTWVHDNSISLFAQWTEHPYTVTTSVSPAGAGTLSCGSSIDARWVTPTATITATANPAWKFVRWEYSANVGPADGTGNDNTVQIKASVDGTLTAVFEPRFCLVGSIWNDSGNGGMPGWSDHTADFIVNSYTDLSTMNLTCVRSLDPNTTYKFEVHDKVKGKNFGYSEASTFIADQSLLFNKQNEDVLLRVNGHGECTFTISALSSGDLYPTVSVAIPASHQLKLEWAYVRINGDWYKTSDAVGGTVSAQTTESGHHFTIHNDEYVAHGGDITYTATPATGYTFEGWYNNDYNTLFSTTNPYTSSNIQTTEKVEAKFVEKATAVTLSNDGHGHVEIDGEMVSNTTVGVTTTRELTAVPNEGYKFDSWTIVSGSDITLSSTSTNPTTLSGNGAGAASGQEVRANFVERWALKAESVGWGHTEFNIENISTNASGDVVGYVDISLSANTSYQFTMYDKQESQTYKNGSDRVYYMTNGNSHNWSFATDKTWNCGITTAGAGTYRFIWNITDKKMTVTYPNFIIYRTGDKAEDPRAQYTDAESYEGGTIEKAIEFRMKVQTIDQWYSLSLPFAVSSVKVWDDEDGAYYDIVPYYRTGGKFYTGHYIIRKPETVTNYAIETFEERWVDPENSGVLPEKNIPYIIQWHDPYFLGKYISFFGSTNQAIPSDFNAGEAPSADDVVNVFGNNTMHSGTVRDAYLLDKDYGPSGAWLREDIGTDRTILPFECFIRASQQGTARYRIIRRGMEIDTPTALEQISNHQSPMTIRVYTITGVLIGEYNDCSFQDAAHRIATDHNEGIYILRSENESMKLLLGGK
ncbi:MAG: InlB B-repeat-containing protein [Paludibacteraceae bacterium]|nr:InlB B-repeat-containing protein [Paludibacteraceae bacterium]